MIPMKTFKDSITHNVRKCDVVYVPADTFTDIPDELILKAHAACFCEGKMLLVNHSEWDIWSIPGGTREHGESIEQTLAREIQEETNCCVVDYRPISYQKVMHPDGGVHYRLQYVCNVVPIGEFESDPAGNVKGVCWIDPERYGGYIEKKEMREVILQRAIAVYRDRP